MINIYIGTDYSVCLLYVYISICVLVRSVNRPHLCGGLECEPASCPTLGGKYTLHRLPQSHGP